MKTPRHLLTALRHRGQAAFTMVEIALALAVIGFALVAIVGVLPLGMEAQKQNREDTVIDHDANFFLDGIRNGARGLDDLTNYVYEIRHNFTEYQIGVPASGNYLGTSVYRVDPVATPTSPFDNAPVVAGYPINTGARIIGLLGWPKYMPSPDPNKSDYFISNNVVAYVRALTGAATEKVPQANPSVRELAFNYRMTSEIVPIPVPPFTNVVQMITNSSYASNLRANLHEVRLLFRWPVKPDGEPGPSGREVYRTQVGGRHVSIQDTNNQVLFFFQPLIYQRLPQT